MTAAMCQALPSFYSDYNNKSLFSVFSELYEKKHRKPRLWRVYSRFFLFLRTLQVSINFNRNLFSQILQRLDKYQYIYQEIDCHYTLYEHGFYSSIVKSSWEVFNQRIWSVQHNLRRKGVIKNTKSIKETTRSEKVQKTLSKF